MVDRSDMSPEDFSPGDVGEPVAGDQVAEPEWLRDGGAPVRPRPAATAQRAGRPPRSGSWLRRRRGALLAVAAAVVVVGTVTVAGLALNSSDSAPPAAQAAATEPEPDEAWCAGLGAGSPASVDADDPGEAAIAGFEYAYYVLRDGGRAREYGAADARNWSVESLSEGIRQIPVGTTHCVLVRKAIDGVYAVDLFERRPDGSANHYVSMFHTVTTPGGTKIAKITEREE